MYRILEGLVEHKIALFANDIILFLKKSNSSIPALTELIETSGKKSGYKINYSESSIMLLSESDRINGIVLVSPFNSTDNFTSLGRNIFPEVNKISQINYDSLQETTAWSLECWTSLPMSKTGRIKILKINILPKFLYSKIFPNPLPPRLLERENCLPTSSGKITAQDYVYL